jgi:hypothetical protein
LTFFFFFGLALPFPRNLFLSFFFKFNHPHDITLSSSQGMRDEHPNANNEKQVKGRKT